jgi:hypothetical protein
VLGPWTRGPADTTFGSGGFAASGGSSAERPGIGVFSGGRAGAGAREAAGAG